MTYKYKCPNCKRESEHEKRQVMVLCGCGVEMERVNNYIEEELRKAEKYHDWNYNIKAKFSGTNGESKFLEITYKDWLKIKDILRRANYR